MQDYVIDLPQELVLETGAIDAQIRPLWVEGKFAEAEALFREQYELISAREAELPEGQRYHKGYSLHNWGISILLQKNPARVKEGYGKIFLAYIEDLLDFDNIEKVHDAPAYRTLTGNPFLSNELLEMVHSQVEVRKRTHRIPKNPEDILTDQLNERTQGAIDNFTTNKPKVVYVVHGRNLDALNSMYAFLDSIGLQHLTFPEAALRTGKASPYIGEVLEAIFSLATAVVVLMTPDDEGCLRKSFRKPDDKVWETRLTSQPRLNVVFEAGMAMGGHSRERTILVELGELRPFSDISGVFTVKLDNAIDRRKHFIDRLQIAGCSVDLSSDDWCRAGDFESVVADKTHTHLSAWTRIRALFRKPQA